MTTDVREMTPYLRLYHALRDQIVAGEHARGLPAIHELAAHYRVNPNTVKKALNQLKEHRFIYGVRGKGLFVNPDGAVNPLAQKNVTLYLHRDVMMNPFYNRLVFELRTRLERERCAVHFINSLSQLKSFAGQIDALLLFEQFEARELAYLETLVARARILYCNCRAPEGSFEIGTDNRAGGRMAMAHLYDSGCRRVGALCVSDVEGESSHFLWRRRGVLEFQAAHPDLDVDLVDIPMPFLLRHMDMDWTRRFFRDGREPDGFFLFMDVMAFSLYELLRERGARPPVLGFDDQEFAGWLYPALSTLREDAEGIADGAIRMIRSILTGGAKPERVWLPPFLIERESTRPVRAGHASSVRAGHASSHA